MRTGSVVVYNLGGQEILSRVTVKHAMTMVWRGVARVLEAEEESDGLIDRPRSLELLRYVVAKWKYANTGEVPFSKIGVFRRDNFTCAYCGDNLTRSECTADHILPKWQGNSASWNNSITSCFPCNNKKGGRSPKEAGMKLLFQPRTPTFHEAFNWTRDRD